MPGLLPDHDVEGHCEILFQFLTSESWRDVWQSLDLKVHSFASLNLPTDARDSLIWQHCQQCQIVLITGNRKDEGPESLAATIRKHNRPDSLPVFTLANPRRIQRSAAYARRVAVQLLDYLMALEKLRGAGRIFLP